jgi:hypothetical protein
VLLGQIRILADLARCWCASLVLFADHQVPAQCGDDADDQEPEQDQEPEAQGGYYQIVH